MQSFHSILEFYRSVLLLSEQRECVKRNHECWKRRWVAAQERRSIHRYYVTPLRNARAGDDRKCWISSIGMVTERPWSPFVSHTVAATIREKFALETRWRVTGGVATRLFNDHSSDYVRLDICHLLQSYDSTKVFRSLIYLTIITASKVSLVTQWISKMLSRVICLFTWTMSNTGRHTLIEP